MTEQELIEKVIALLEEVWNAGRDYSQVFDFLEYLNRTPQWKSQIPALIKEAGWRLPNEPTQQDTEVLSRIIIDPDDPARAWRITLKGSEVLSMVEIDRCPDCGSLLEQDPVHKLCFRCSNPQCDYWCGLHPPSQRKVAKEEQG